MNTLAAVLKDLYHFVTVERFGLKTLPQPAHRPLLLGELKKVSNVSTVEKLSQGLQVYVAVFKAPLYIHPTESFDTVTFFLHYGTPVLLLNTSGRFAEIQSENHRGWILKDTLHASVVDIWPQLKNEIVYDAAHQETGKLRAVINDEFNASSLGLPLQSVEYVYFKLLQKKSRIIWPMVRPRIAGTWQQILKGEERVRIGIHPRPGSILERVYEDGTGHVAFVEAVFPDQAIRISEVGREIYGCYTEETVAKSVWREWRPVFLEIYNL